MAAAEQITGSSVSNMHSVTATEHPSLLLHPFLLPPNPLAAPDS